MAGGKGKSPREYGRRARSARAAPAAASRGSGQGGGEAPPAPSASAAAGQLMSPADSMAGPDLQSGYFGGGRPRGPSLSAAERGGRGGSFQLGDSQHSLGGTAGEAEPAAEGAPRLAAAGNDSSGGEDDDGTLQEAEGAVDGKHPASLGADGRALAVSASALSMATSQSGLSTGLSTPLGGDASPAGPPGPGTATTAEDDLRDVEAARTRRNSADEDILLGRGPKRGPSAASLGGRADGDEGGPGGKRHRGPPADDNDGDAAVAEKTAGRPDRSALLGLYARPLDVAPSREYHVSAAGYSVRRNLDVPAPPVLPVTDGSSLSSSGGGDASVESFRTARSDLDEQAPPADEGLRRGHRHTARWRAHRMAEDYVSLASSIVLPPVRVGPYGDVPLLGSYPVEQPTALGYLLSPLRRPTVIENWNPREIALFEASLSVHGKLFHVVSGHVGTKSTKEVVEFYYIWKKTAHYGAWKGRYRPLIMESDVSDDEDGEEGAGGGR